MVPKVFGVTAAFLAQNLKVHEAIVEGWIKKGILKTTKTVSGQTVVPAEAEGDDPANLKTTILMSFNVDIRQEETEDKDGPCPVIKFDKTKITK